MQLCPSAQLDSAMVHLYNIYIYMFINLLCMFAKPQILHRYVAEYAMQLYACASMYVCMCVCVCAARSQSRCFGENGENVQQHM